MPQLRDRLAKEQSIHLPLDEIEAIEHEHGLDQRFEHDGQVIGPCGPYTLDDFVAFPPEQKRFARLTWICSWCNHIGGLKADFVMCGACKATTARYDVWCAGSCLKDDKRHLSLCGTLCGVLPVADPERHSPAARWQLNLQHEAVKAGRDAYFAAAEPPVVSDFYFGGAVCKLLKIKSGLEQPLFTVGRIGLTEFRQTYAGALEKALFPSDERHSAAAGVLEAIAAGLLDGKPIAGRGIFTKFVALLRTQLTNELGDNPSVPYAKVAVAPFPMLDVRELVREVVGRAVACPPVGQSLGGIPVIEGVPARMTEELTKLWDGEDRSPASTRKLLAIGFGRHMPMLDEMFRQGVFRDGKGFEVPAADRASSRLECWGPFHISKLTLPRREALELILASRPEILEPIHQCIWRLSGSIGEVGTGPIKLMDLDEPLRRRLYFLVFHDRDLWLEANRITAAKAPPPPVAAAAPAKPVTKPAPIVKPSAAARASLAKKAAKPSTSQQIAESFAPTSVLASASRAAMEQTVSAMLERPPAPGSAATTLSEALAYLNDGVLPTDGRGPQVAKDAQGLVEGASALFELLPKDPAKLKEFERRLTEIVAASPPAIAGADAQSRTAGKAFVEELVRSHKSVRVQPGAVPSSTPPVEAKAGQRTAVAHPGSSSIDSPATSMNGHGAASSSSAPAASSSKALEASSEPGSSAAWTGDSAAKLKSDIWTLLGELKGVALKRANKLLDDAEANSQDRKGKGKAQVPPEVLFDIRAQIRTMVAAAEAKANSAPASARSTPTKTARSAPATSNADVDELMRTVGCSRAAAIRSLRERNGDLTAALMSF